MKTRKRHTTKNKTQKVFNEADYESNNGMLTMVWGPSMWHFLHTISFNYPVQPTQQDKIHYRDFVLHLENVLPCKKCRSNLHKNLKKLPLKMEHLKTRATFSLYIYKLHELVNKMLGKNSGITYEMARERYEHFRARCTQPIDKTPEKKENGCVEPLNGEKSKCLLHIVPVWKKCETFTVDKRCIKKRLT